MGILSWSVVGLIAGFLASQMKRGLILCLVVLGALIGFSVTTTSASAADTPVTLAPGATVRIPVDGMVFKPASGTSEQTLISHLDVPIGPTTLPTTGEATPQDARVPSLFLLVLGASLLRFGVWIRSGR